MSNQVDNYKQELPRQANDQDQFTNNRIMPRISNENLTAKNALQRPETVRRKPGALSTEEASQMPTRLLIA